MGVSRTFPPTRWKCGVKALNQSAMYLVTHGVHDVIIGLCGINGLSWSCWVQSATCKFWYRGSSQNGQGRVSVQMTFLWPFWLKCTNPFFDKPRWPTFQESIRTMVAAAAVVGGEGGGENVGVGAGGGDRTGDGEESISSIGGSGVGEEPQVLGEEGLSRCISSRRNRTQDLPARPGQKVTKTDWLLRLLAESASWM